MALHRRPGGSQTNVGLLRHALLGGTAAVSLLAFAVDFTGITSLPSWLSFSRGSHAMVTDSTGKLTYAPNNCLLQSENVPTSWATGDLAVTGGVSDPDGGNNAFTLTASANGAIIYQQSSATANFIASVWMRRRTGTSTIVLRNPNNTDTTAAVTGSWQRLSTSGPSGGLATFAIVLTASGDAIDIYHPQLEAVTYETSPRTYNPTTTAAYYGPRFNYAWNGSAYVAKGLLEEDQRTNLCPYDEISKNGTGSGWQYSGGTTGATSATLSKNGSRFMTQVTSASGLGFQTVFTPSSLVTTTANQLFFVAFDFKKTNWNYVFVSIGSDATNNYAAVVFDLSNNTATETKPGSAGGAVQETVIEDLGNGIVRLGFVGSIGAANTLYAQFGFAGQATGNGWDGFGNAINTYSFTAAETLLVDAAIVSAGSTKTSHIPTYGAAVIRYADILTLAGAAATAAKGASGTIFIETGELPANNPVGVNTVLVCSTNYFPLFRDSGSNNRVSTYIFRTGGAQLFTPALSDWTAINRAGIAYDGTSCSIVADGGAVQNGTGTEDWAADGNIYIGVGSTGVQSVNGHLRFLGIATSRFSNAALQAGSVVGAII